MLQPNDIKHLLNIQDPSISLTQLDKKTINGKLTNVVKGILTYIPVVVDAVVLETVIIPLSSMVPSCLKFSEIK